MTERPKIAASILAADIGFIAHEVQDVVNGGTDWLHLDIMDGSFVPPITFGANIVSFIKANSDRFLDVHLMIDHPEHHVESFIQAGADLITIHVEAASHVHRTLGMIREHGSQVGIAINPGTPISDIEPVLDLVDLVLVMTVNPGWGGQSFIESTLPKIETLSDLRKRRELNFLIEVDGGIQPETARECFSLGADVFVAGSYIFSAKNRKEAIKSLREAIATRVN